MAVVRMGDRDRRRGSLPNLCMRCGQPALMHKSKKFSWFPGWVYLLLLAGLLPFVIVALIMTKRKWVDVPLCEAHRRLFLWPQLFILGGVVALVLLAIFAVSLLGRPAGSPEAQLGGILCPGWYLGGLVWLIAVALWLGLLIRPQEITDSSITLRNVSPEFARAFREARQSAADEWDDAVRARWSDRGARPRTGGTDRYQQRPGDDPGRPTDAVQEGP
jgi:hypothetical protein